MAWLLSNCYDADDLIPDTPFISENSGRQVR